MKKWLNLEAEVVAMGGICLLLPKKSMFSIAEHRFLKGVL